MWHTAQSAVSRFLSPWKKTSRKRNPTKTENWAFPQELCRRFSLAEIIAATEGFNDRLYIGSGAFADVYKGYINNTVVAIKRLSPNNLLQPVLSAFKKEVVLFSQLRHPNLVSFIGFCQEQGECILVYEYMPNGTFSDHLLTSRKDPMLWKQRLEICIGAARGIHFLHAGVKHAIIHGDIKSLNILLDERFVPKLSAFGLSKISPPPNLSNAAIKTDLTVSGSIGHIDPEYMQPSDKSDVHSFGYVLFEVLCAKYWAGGFQECKRRETILDIMDPFLIGQIAPDSLRKFMEIAGRCMHPSREERPTIGEVEVELVLALELQESADASKALETSTSIGRANDYNYQGITFHAIDDIFF